MASIMHRALCMMLWALPGSGAVAAPERFQCSIEAEAAANIIDLRDRGHDKAFVLAPLPPRESVFNGRRGTLQARLAVQMYSIIEDVYGHPDIEAATYLAYRDASCGHRNAGRKVPQSLDEVVLPMRGCQAKHGARPSAALTQCAADVLIYYQSASHEPRED